MTIQRPRKASPGRLSTHALLLLAALAGCAHVPAEAYVPDDAVVAVGVPRIAQTLGGVKAAESRFGETAAVRKSRSTIHDPLLAETGLDLDHPETLRARGFDPQRGLFISVAADQSVGVVLPVRDKAAVDQFLRDLFLRKSATPPTFEQRKIGGTAVTVVVRERPKLAWTFAHDYIIVGAAAPGDQVAEYAAHLAHLQKNLTHNPTFTEAKKRLGPQDVIVFSDGDAGKRALRQELLKEKDPDALKTKQALLAYYRGSALGLRVSAQEVALRLFLATTQDRGPALHQVLRGLAKAPAFGHLIGADVMGLLRLSLDVRKLLALVHELSPKAAPGDPLDGAPPAVAAPARELLSLLSGRFAVAVYAPDAQLLQADAGQVSKILLGTPAAIMVQLTKPDRAMGLLTLAGALLARDSGPVRTERQGQTLYTVALGREGVIDWTVIGDVLVVGTASGVERVVDQLQKPGSSAAAALDPPRAREILQSEDGLLLYGDLGRITAAMSAANPAHRTADVDQALPLLARLRDALLGIELSDDSVLADILVRMK